MCVVENGGDLNGRTKKRSQESVGPVDVDPGHLNSRKEAGRKAQGARGLNNNCRKSVSPLSCLIKGFRSNYHCSPPGRINASGLK